MATQTLTPGLGPIEPTILYPLDDLKARSGLGVAAFRELRRQGLSVRYLSGRAFVLGKDFIDHALEHAKDHK